MLLTSHIFIIYCYDFIRFKFVDFCLIQCIQEIQMKFIADLHVHSKFSMATAKNLDLENLYIAAQLKGITVVGTGDITHPGWLAEIKEKLTPAEPGLFKLKKELARECDKAVPALCRSKVRFILVSEISNIYKKNGKTRKNHNLVFLPDIESTEIFNSKLDKIGNIKSDGRPILGLDARNLLEILLETTDKSFLIPAHIWTPWFSVLGSKSGFDSIKECFEDLSGHIFAIETGLSSDPPMNWRVSQLDGLTLVSNSDAHSPLKLGREANILDTELSYSAIKSAIKSGDPDKFLGTYEFFPEEGKYHMDGHRKCNICFSPTKTIEKNGNCPVCGKPLTLGVLYRVEELSDRNAGFKPEKAHPFYSAIPLVDILSSLMQVGPLSKKVKNAYNNLIEKYGPEFPLLHSIPIDDLNRSNIPLLGEAIKRVRKKDVTLLPGYDGEYGKIIIFTPEERETLPGQKSLFIIPGTDPLKKTSSKKIHIKKIKTKKIKTKNHDSNHSTGKAAPKLNKEQLKAVQYSQGALLIIAGPGTGKTHTITHRMAHLIKNKGVNPENILAVTFTNRAAGEMKERIRKMAGEKKSIPLVSTFHSLCFKILNENTEFKGYAILDDNDRKSIISDALKHVKKNSDIASDLSVPGLSISDLQKGIMSAKQSILKPDDNLESVKGDTGAGMLASIYSAYQSFLSSQKLLDYEDLIFKTVELFENNNDIAKTYQDRFEYIFVDEYQDLNHGQYRIVKALAPQNGNQNKNICVIGDPDQSIYGFRGSDVSYFNRFIKDYPQAMVLNLTQNYRSSKTIIDASYQIIKKNSITGSKTRVYSEKGGFRAVEIIENDSEKSEAVAVAGIIEKLIGGTGFHSIDFGRAEDVQGVKSRSFSDFAVLYRTGNQGKILSTVFEKHGIPCQVVSRETIFGIKKVAELVSLLKTVEGFGTFADLGRINSLLHTGTGRATLEIFKIWSYENRFTLSEALTNAAKFPVSGLSASRQTRLNEFFNIIFELKNKTKTMTVTEKLIFFSENISRINAAENTDETNDAIKRLFDIASEYGDNTCEFLSALLMQTDTDTYINKAEKVALMTMHTAKGLEFPVVFVTGCEKDYIPFRRSPNIQVDVDEERRLFYVAMTRAEEKLYLTYAKKRRIYGKIVKRQISPFVRDIENDLVKYKPSGFKKKKKNLHTQIKLF